MTTLEVLAEARQQGVDLWIRADGNIGWRSAKPVPVAMRQRIAEHKPELLRVLGPEWDQAEADQLKAQLREGLAEIERLQYGGKFPSGVGNLAKVSIEVAERIDRGHAQEWRRGWDPMALLRDAVATGLRLARQEASHDDTDETGRQASAPVAVAKPSKFTGIAKGRSLFTERRST